MVIMCLLFLVVSVLHSVPHTTIQTNTNKFQLPKAFIMFASYIRMQLLTLIAFFVTSTFGNPIKRNAEAKFGSLSGLYGLFTTC